MGSKTLICSVCHKKKLLNEFTLNKNRRLSSRCDECKANQYPKYLPVIGTKTMIRIKSKTGEYLKKCGSCKLWLPESNFAYRKKARDKLQSWCTSCNSKVRRKT